MKLASSGCSAILRRSSSGFCSGKWDLPYSSTATSTDSLYSRISPRRKPEGSIIPVLDQWVKEGRDVQKRELKKIIKEMRWYNRFKPALEVSEWMSEKGSIELNKHDIAARLDLISRVFGTEKAETYFNGIAPEFKNTETYNILVSCYARSKSVEKAEATMQKMKDLGFMATTSSYNDMLNLYRKKGEKHKIEALSREMEEKGVKFDKFTFGTILTSYVDTSDIEGTNMTLQKMDSIPQADLDWRSYSIAANLFVKAGDTEKALAMVKKSEEIFIAVKPKGKAFDTILSHYAALGRKEEIRQFWEVRNKAEVEPPPEGSYMTAISSLLKLDDVEGAEKIFEEWESREVTHEIRLLNRFVRAYSRKGLMDKAKEFIDRTVAKGAVPVNNNTWYYMVLGYVCSNQMSKAVEALKLAVSAESKPGWNPTGCLAVCLEYLQEKGDAEEAGEFLGCLVSCGIISDDVHDRLFCYVKDSKSWEEEDAIRILKGQLGD